MRYVCSLLLAVTLSTVARADQDGGSRLHLGDPLDRITLRKALEEASRRLQRPECQSLFSAFRDPHGRPLTHRLNELALAPPDYLRVIVFEDGRHPGVCAGETLAYTVPGSRVVFVCGSRFTAAWRNHPERTVAAVIHEALHTLGLGENPPSSSEITDRVRLACGFTRAIPDR